MLSTATLTIIALLGSAAAEPVLQPPYAMRLVHRSTPPNSLEKREFAQEMENQHYDTSYVVELKVGTPPQSVYGLLSSESSVIEMYGRPGNAGNAANGLDDPGFLANKSSSFKDLDHNATFVSRASDTLTFGNDTRENVEFYYAIGPGNPQVFGFGFPNDRGPPQTSFWHNVSESWADKRVGLFLSRHRTDPGGEKSQSGSMGYMDSEVMVGGVNEAKYTGELASHPFTPDKNGYWLLPLEGITVNGNAINLNPSGAANSSQTASNSTGTNSSQTPSKSSSSPMAVVNVASQLMGPAAAIKEIYANIPGAQLVRPESNPRNATYQFPCENTLSIDVRFTIGGREYAMNPRDMVVGTVDDRMFGDGYANAATPANGRCVGAFMVSYVEDGRWHIGKPFLKNVYTVFDFATPAVAFGTLAPDAQPSIAGRVISKSSSAIRISTSLAAVAGVAAGILCNL